jgi:hypothetical protein
MIKTPITLYAFRRPLPRGQFAVLYAAKIFQVAPIKLRDIAHLFQHYPSAW